MIVHFVIQEIWGAFNSNAKRAWNTTYVKRAFYVTENHNHTQENTI